MAVKGIRAVRGKLVPDKDGFPVVEVNQDDLRRAAWELMIEKYYPEPEEAKPLRLPLTRRLLRWVERWWR